MRRPKDINAELEALAARTRALKARKVVQLGELVIGASADVLETEVLVGALLTAARTSEPRQIAIWREHGIRYFRREQAPTPSPSDADSARAPQNGCPDETG